MDKEEFDFGAAKLDEILGLKADYKDVAELKSYARLEPLYRKGNQALEMKNIERHMAFLDVQFRIRIVKSCALML